WGKFSSTYKISYSLILVLGILLLLIGYWNGYDISTSSSSSLSDLTGIYQNSEITVLNSITMPIIYNYHFITGLGIAFILVSGYLFYGLYRLKKRSLKETMRNLNKFDDSISNTEFEITNDYISIRNQIEEKKYRWEKFRQFRVLGNYIFIFEHTYIDGAFLAINKDLITKEQADELVVQLYKKFSSIKK